MITEDYVSFETAKLLKEKGFNECCHLHYHYVESFDRWFQTSEYIDRRFKKYYYPCPTLQMAMKWLREKQIFITIGFCDYPALHKSEWVPEVCTHNSIFDKPSIAYSTYEEACEAAIKYCLENLIP